MQHVDEGILHAYLDGALDALAAEGALPHGVTRSSVAAHFRSCPDCSALLEDERLVRDGARVVLLDASVTVDAPPFELVAHGRTQQPAPRIRSLPWLWAATVVIAVGAGWWGSELLRVGADGGDAALASAELAGPDAPADAPDAGRVATSILPSEASAPVGARIMAGAQATTSSARAAAAADMPAGSMVYTGEAAGRIAASPVAPAAVAASPVAPAADAASPVAPAADVTPAAPAEVKPTPEMAIADAGITDVVLAGRAAERVAQRVAGPERLVGTTAVRDGSSLALSQTSYLQQPLGGLPGAVVTTAPGGVVTVESAAQERRAAAQDSGADLAAEARLPVPPVAGAAGAATASAQQRSGVAERTMSFRSSRTPAREEAVSPLQTFRSAVAMARAGTLAWMRHDVSSALPGGLPLIVLAEGTAPVVATAALAGNQPMLRVLQRAGSGVDVELLIWQEPGARVLADGRIATVVIGTGVLSNGDTELLLRVPALEAFVMLRAALDARSLLQLADGLAFIR
jgi:hypothetical protein